MMSVSTRGRVEDDIDTEVGREGKEWAVRSWGVCPLTDCWGGEGLEGWVWADDGLRPVPCGGSGPGGPRWSWGSCSSLLWQSGQV